MTFKTGISGNPTGRPHGVLNKATKLAKLLHPHAEKLVQKAVELALSGDAQALRLCIERLIPRAKNETISFSLPEGDLLKAESLPVMGAEVLKAISDQRITTEQGKSICDVLEYQRRSIELQDIEARISCIEHTLNQRVGVGHVKY